MSVKIRIPVDLSTVEDLQSGQKVRVAIRDAQGKLHSKLVSPRRGRANAEFELDERPASLQVLVGPGDVEEDELEQLDVLQRNLTLSHLQGDVLEVEPIRVTPVLWRRWLSWCRTFTVTGRVICPGGGAVPGAQVCAYDVDYWWWWGSRQLVGCATTDQHGNFSLKYRWCCGLRPIWWWKLRDWRLEPVLADLIVPELQKDPRLRNPPRPEPQPDPAIFDRLVRAGEDLQRVPDRPNVLRPDVRLRPDVLTTGGLAGRSDDRLTLPGTMVAPSTVDLEGLHERLTRARILPHVPELERYQLWPWYPWRPWLDCNPDLVFRVSQSCGGAHQVILNEGFFDTRWNVPTEYDVTLVADTECCIVDEPPPDEECALLHGVCWLDVDQVGGNPGAPPSLPAGYATGDRPFGGSVQVRGQIGGVDYYGVEISANGGVTWTPLTEEAFDGFTRRWWEPPSLFQNVPFPAQVIDGKRVIETIGHHQANNSPGSWGTSRFWLGTNYDSIVYWDTDGHYNDGTYQLRVRGYTESGGNLTDAGVLPTCATQTDAGLVLTIDNRFEGGASGHPTAPDHPCGGGTVHTCTTEPDTDILRVTVGGQVVNPCSVIDASGGGNVVIDFLAHDPDGHLSHYSLQATYGENQVVPLLSLGTLSASPVPAPVPAAAQVGPDYSDALGQGATRPTWNGGAIRLTIADLHQAFQISCSYQLELRAFKRTIVSCNGDHPHRNLSEYSFAVQV